ncbi:hypothetical protein [Priestia megaterium]|uniref:hypothetical protein n=1 Tax=Priestia megaterium TaxID=1404 RepID=UPI00112BDF31|nr:hypothetical protein [Priestia megaterium]TPF18017.1 hypothetical protein CBE78_01975 [Priestia megaterium]TPF22124.1 hypothetical protein CBE79_04480 [Priestia megaterium]
MRIEDIQEGSYLYCKTAEGNGMQEVRVIEKVKVEVGYDVWDDGIRYMYYFNGQIHDSIQHPDQFTQTKSFRKPKCYECDLEINENKYKVELCNMCKWLKCPRDGACGCNYRGY